MKTSLILVALSVAVGLSQNGVDAFGKKPGYVSSFWKKPGYVSRLQCSGMPRICRTIWVPYEKPKPRKFCYTDGGRNNGDYKLTTCEIATKNCKRTNRKMYHEKYHGKREDDSVYLCEYVPPRRLIRRRLCCRARTPRCLHSMHACKGMSFDYDEDFDDAEEAVGEGAYVKVNFKVKWDEMDDDEYAGTKPGCHRVAWPCRL